MAFQFNWSPLIADTSRARDMLTSALNKSPKPPIIVDDIVVTELNLGTVAPELEILEIGDLAQDRFRGIFKLAYAGDAFLTLQTRVQANPLNTYVSTIPDFTSPQPLAADSGLTIPLQITLSDFKLSGFVIVVFSRQKGLTLVFRNDPLESLKVSSTFDSIPFVRDLLQRIIEQQLRNLFVDDLPAIIHRLSLRLWSPDYRDPDDHADTTEKAAPFVYPTTTHENGHPEVSEAESPFTMPDQFSQRNILRLAFLREANSTMSLYTPSLPDTVVRASTFFYRAEKSSYFSNVGLSRAHSTLSVSSVASFRSDPDSAPIHGSSQSISSRPTTASGLGISQKSRIGTRPRKRRVVDLRNRSTAEPEVGATSATSEPEPVADSTTQPSAPATATPTSPITAPGSASGSPSLPSRHILPGPSLSRIPVDRAPLYSLHHNAVTTTPQLTIDDPVLPEDEEVFDHHSVPPPSYTEHPDITESSFLCPIGKDALESPATTPQSKPFRSISASSPPSPLSGAHARFQHHHNHHHHSLSHLQRPNFLRTPTLPVLMQSSNNILHKRGHHPPLFSQSALLRSQAK